MNIRNLVLAGVLAPLFSVSLLATQQLGLEMQLGNPTGATADSTNHTHYLLQCAQYSLDYSDSLGEPNWVAWDLTASDVGSAGRTPTFYPDTRLPSDFYEVTTKDYDDSGFNRGHMCDSEDRTDTAADNRVVFFLSNIIPQTADNNQGPWELFEAYCRTEAAAGYEVLITSGPSHFNGSKIPSGKAAIPGFCWKIAVFVPAGSGTALSRVSASTRIVAVRMPNISGIRNANWTAYISSVNQLQADTGFTFLSALPAATAEVLRAKVDGAAVPSVTGVSPDRGPSGSTVTVTGTGFTGSSLVEFDGVKATSFTVNSATSITVKVPLGSASGRVAIVAPGGLATSSSRFTVSDAATHAQAKLALAP